MLTYVKVFSAHIYEELSCRLRAPYRPTVIKEIAGEGVAADGCKKRER